MADPGLDRDPALRRRPQVGDVEVGVQDLAERPRDRRRGHEQDVRRVAAGLGLELAALLDAEPVLLVDDDDAEVGERDPLLDAGRGSRRRPVPGRRRARSQRAARVRPRSASRSGARPGCRVLEEVGQRRRGAAARGGRSGRGGRPGGRPAPQAPARRRRRPSCPSRRRPGGAGASASVGPGRSRIAVDRRRPGPAVSSTARPTFRDERRGERRPDAPRRARRRRRSARPRLATALAAPADHPELEREQLVEGEPPERGVAAPRTTPGSGPPRAPSPIPAELDSLRGSAAAGTPGRPRRPGRAPRASRSAGGSRSARP